MWDAAVGAAVAGLPGHPLRPPRLRQVVGANDRPYSPVADLVALMDHLELKRANLVGNSMGGTLALDFALLHSRPHRRGRRRRERRRRLPGAGGRHEEVSTRCCAPRATREPPPPSPLWLQHPMVGVAIASSDRRPAPAHDGRGQPADVRGRALAAGADVAAGLRPARAV